jgi:hypothetical protein
MTEQNSITPPPELMEQWMQAHSTKYDLAREAAQWGADTELEACCEALDMVNGSNYWSQVLRSGRRPKPPSLKEQALHELAGVYNRDEIDDAAYETIRRALEALPDD